MRISKKVKQILPYIPENQVAFIVIFGSMLIDIIVAGISDDEIQEIKNIFSKHFKVKNLGLIQQYLEVKRDLEGNFELCQSSYIEKTAFEFGLSDAKTVKLPIDSCYERLESANILKDNTKYRKLVGCLLYISVNTRPDISATVNILAQKVFRQVRNIGHNLNEF